MTMAAALAGYLIGSVPTAGWLGRLVGIDLRAAGSGNPGTNNALRTRGPALAAAVLIVEAAKGYAAVWLGGMMVDEAGAVAAGIGAVAGNVYNVWYRFQGGKGLGISLGVLAAAWPTALLVTVAVIISAVLITRSAGLASLAAMAGLIVASVLWTIYDWPTGGVAPGPQLIVLSVAMSVIMVWKHWRDSPLNPAWRSPHRTPV